MQLQEGIPSWNKILIVFLGGGRSLSFNSVLVKNILRKKIRGKIL